MVFFFFLVLELCVLSWVLNLFVVLLHGKEQVAQIAVTRALPQAVSLVSTVLKILSFRLGTLLLCGHLCLDWKWPFIHKFSEMPLEKREKILKKWSKEKRLIPLKLVFVLIKLFCFYTFFTRVIYLPNSHSTLTLLFFLTLSIMRFLFFLHWNSY